MTARWFASARVRLVVPAALVALTAAPLAGCTQAGCPRGSEVDGDRCVPDTCGPEEAFFADADGDGFGDPGDASCAPSAGFVAVSGDCDDGAAAVNPGASETCDGVDQDCDGVADQTFACPSAGLGPCETSCGSTGTQACTASCEPIGACEPPAEVCNGVDDDCDGIVDEGALALTAGRPVGQAGDYVVGLAAAPDGFVAFLVRGDQIVAQPLDASGQPTGEEVPMFDGTPPEVSAYDVAANDSTAYVVYVASNIARVRAFDFATASFGASAELHATESGFSVAKIAATNHRVMVILAAFETNGDEDTLATGVVAIDPALEAPGDFVVLHESRRSFGAYLATQIAAPGHSDAPWPATYYRPSDGEVPAARMLVGLSSTGQVSVAAAPLTDVIGINAIAASPDVGVVARNAGGTLELQPFGASTLGDDVGEPASSDSSVTGIPVAEPALGRLAIAYARTTPGGKQLTVALYDGALARTDVFVADPTSTLGVLGAAGRPESYAVITRVDEMPFVHVLGCAP